ncbi:MAG: glycosyltransferase [Anaerolineae bacterium]|nr:glycosyltransferase [Anaerolineae bacterium]
MRVLIVTHRFPPDGIAGVERITQTLAYELAGQGDEVRVVCCRPQPTYDPQPVRELLPNGVLVERYLGGPVPLDFFLFHHTDMERHFERTLLEFAPDVVHGMHLLDLSPRFVEIAHHYQVGVVLSLQDFFLACPLIILRKTNGALCAGPDGGRECARTCFAAEGDRALLRWGLRAVYYRRVLGMAERLIAPSQYVADYFVRYGAEAARMRVIPNGVSIPPAPSANGYVTPRQRGQLNLAFLGSVMPHKGPHLILEALKLAGLDAVDLTLIGQSPHAGYAQALRETAAKIPGLTLRLYGAYEPYELPWLLHAVDCVVTPSIWPETFAIVTREALRRGIPLVTTRVGALPEAVVEGVNGFTFDPDRPGELAVLLRRLAEDEALVHRLRAGARATPIVTVAEHAAAVREVYQQAAADLAANPATRPADLAEFQFLHQALIRVGFSGA